MGYVFSSTAGLITLFALGTQAAIALILSLATGLSELHKDLLVGFAVTFPSLVLLILMVMLRAASAPISPEEP